MTVVDVIRIGSRGSALARAQTQWVVDCLKHKCPGCQFEIVVIHTSGDLYSQESAAQSVDKGFFTKEIESALLSNKIDFAVHSLKDLPTELPKGLELGAVTEREDPRDAFAGRTPSEIEAHPGDITFGTSSLRRAAQLKAMFPDCRVTALRGNLDTRLRKVEEGVVDCAVMAAAGLKRLGREDAISAFVGVDDMLPAPGQGALAIEIRAADSAVRKVVEHIHCSDTSSSVAAERAFLQRLGGGCRVPVGALATISRGTLQLKGRVISLNGTCCFDGNLNGPPDQAVKMGQQLAVNLLERGAGRVLEEILNDGSESTRNG